MQLSNLLFVLALPVIAFACEGACITEVTNAWFTNYTQVVTNVLRAGDLQLSNRLGEPTTFEIQGDGVSHFEPFLDAFKKDAFDILERDIFPGFFHGKCQRKGIEPAGCPNPDCPVVCGTPGSMIHFFDKLVEIAFHAVLTLLQSYADVKSEPYKKVLESVKSHSHPRSLRFARTTFYPEESESVSAGGFLKRTAEVETILKTIADELPHLLGYACNAKGEVDEKHKHCSWKKEMTTFILTFP